MAAVTLALVTDAFGGRGGIAQYNRDFLTAFAAVESDEAQASLIIVLPRRTPDKAAPPLGIQQTSPQPSRLAYIFRALILAFTRHFDIIFCGHLYMAPLAATIAKLKGAKLIIQTHGIEAWPRPSKIQRASLELADFVLCVSRYTRAAVLKWAAIVPERVLVLPNTVDEKFTPGDGADLRGEWQLKGKRVLLTVARMEARERYKGQDRVIRALPQLLAAGHDVAYVIVGEGDDLTRLQGIAADCGVVDRVLFTGHLAGDTLINVYRMADLFVMPSKGEGFGIAFIEAMASGTPVVAFESAGARDALADGDLGILTSDKGLPSVIVQALERAPIRGSTLAEKVNSRFGRRRFSENVSRASSRIFESS